MSKFSPNQEVFNTTHGVGVIVALEEEHKIYGQKYRVRYNKSIVPQYEATISIPTEEQKSKIKIRQFIEKSKYRRHFEVYLNLLRIAGLSGIMNDCACEKNPIPGAFEYADVLGNHTCGCITLTKLHHRFSTFKDDLQDFGFVFEDVKTDSGKHKTVLLSEP